MAAYDRCVCGQLFGAHQSAPAPAPQPCAASQCACFVPAGPTPVARELHADEIEWEIQWHGHPLKNP